jgi:hypothetical protein
MKAKIARLYPEHTTIQFKTGIEGVSAAENGVWSYDKSSIREVGQITHTQKNSFIIFVLQ